MLVDSGSSSLPHLNQADETGSSHALLEEEADEDADQADETRSSHLLVEEDVVCRWLELSELRVGSLVARWWQNEVSAEEGAVDALKSADDETVEDLYARIKEEVGRRQEGGGGILLRKYWFFELESARWF